MKYAVHHGLYQRSVEGFETFPEALACFVGHVTDGNGRIWFAPMLVGEGYDGADDDGLTADERAAVELACEVAA